MCKTLVGTPQSCDMNLTTAPMPFGLRLLLTMNGLVLTQEKQDLNNRTPPARKFPASLPSSEPPGSAVMPPPAWAMWAQTATTLTGERRAGTNEVWWKLLRREKNDLLWFLYFPFMTDGKRHLLYDILQTSKNDYYKEWQSFRKHDGAWRNNLSKIHLLKLYAWMESNFLFFQTPYLDLT